MLIGPRGSTLEPPTEIIRVFQWCTNVFRFEPDVKNVISIYFPEVHYLLSTHQSFVQIPIVYHLHRVLIVADRVDIAFFVDFRDDQPGRVQSFQQRERLRISG